MAATRKFRVPMTEQNTTSQKDDGYDKLPFIPALPSFIPYKVHSLIHTVAGVFAKTFTYTYCTTAI